MSTDEEDEEKNDESIEEVRRAYDFSFLAGYPRFISEALSQLDLSAKMQAFNKAAGEAAKMAASVQKAQLAAMKPLEEWKTAQSAVAGLMKGYAAYGDQIKKALEGLKIPKINFPAVDREYLLDPHNQLAIEYGWPPLYRLPLNEPRHLFEEASQIADDEERRRFVDEQITLFYRGELDSIFAGWEAQPFLQGTERLEIIRDGFTAHKDGKYSLSSPVILAQTEGLFIDYLETGRKKAIGHGQYKKHIRRLAKRQGERSITYGLAEILLAFVEEVGLYGRNSPENPIAEDISRHSILHGRSTAYRKREDISLRHLLWMDDVITLINDLNLPKDSGI